ncbi:MAG: hypothetical protein ACIAQF_08155 [Phycisphaerales bacterium JB065]
MSSTLAMACCCDTEVAIAWRVGRRCDGGEAEAPVPVVRLSYLDEIIGCGFLGSAVLLFEGECWYWALDSETVGIVGEPDGEEYVSAESGVSKCACFLCEEEIDLIDPIPGDPEDGAPNCCPSDTGCTTFGSKTVDARVRISGTVFVRTRCGNNPPYTYVENSYSFSDLLSDSGSSCLRSGGAGAFQGSETWDGCTGSYSTNPRLSFSASWDSSNGLNSVVAAIQNLPNMPGSGGGENFRIRLRGGDSDFTAVGAGWSSYDTDAYSYEEFVSGGCEDQFAASGHLELSLNGDQNQVTIDMQVVGVIDNLGACP